MTNNNPNGWTGGSARTIKYLSDEQVTKFFEAIEKVEDSATKARDLCLFHLMLSLGLRCLEAKLLQVSGVNLKASPPMIYITRVKEKHVKKDPKTGEYVRVEKARRGDSYKLSESNTDRLRQWLKVRKDYEYADKSEALFLTRQASTISTNTINYLTHKYGRWAGLPDLYPHQFRHTCAIRLARKGRNSFAIQARLGHVSSISTEVYVKMVGPEKKKEDDLDDAAIEGREDDD